MRQAFFVCISGVSGITVLVFIQKLAPKRIKNDIFLKDFATGGNWYFSRNIEICYKYDFSHLKSDFIKSHYAEPIHRNLAKREQSLVHLIKNM